MVRWRRVDLKALVAERFGVAYHERTIGKLLKALGFLISARGRGTRSRMGGLSRLSKNFPATLAAHFRDLTRIGQKNGLVRQWARRGMRPVQLAD